MRPKGILEELERRRRRAVELVERGESPTQVARILGVQPSSVHRWRRLARRRHGWPTELWTAARVARLIRERFGLDYHPEHVRKILKRRLGWTSQKPRRKARERDDREVERWLGDEFPRIVREAF